MPTRAIRVYNSATSTWEQVGIAQPDTSSFVQSSLVTAKGDLIAATGSATPARVAVGTNGQALLADSTQSTGLRWGSVTVTPEDDQIVLAGQVFG